MVRTIWGFEGDDMRDPFEQRYRAERNGLAEQARKVLGDRLGIGAPLDSMRPPGWLKGKLVATPYSATAEVDLHALLDDLVNALLEAHAREHRKSLALVRESMEKQLLANIRTENVRIVQPDERTLGHEQRLKVLEAWREREERRRAQER